MSSMGAFCAPRAARNAPTARALTTPSSHASPRTHHPTPNTQQTKTKTTGKPFDQLDAHQRVQVGGTVGGELRGGDPAEPERAPPPPDVKFGEDNT